MNKKKQITINISFSSYRKFLSQIGTSSTFKLTWFKNINTVEELIEAYLEEIAFCDKEFSNINNKMQEAMKILDKKGINLQDVFESINDSTDPDEDKKDFYKKS